MQAKERLSPGGVASVAVVLFAVFSFAGWLYETVENALTFSGLYLRASLMLPWCPIYGIGGLLIVALQALGVWAPVKDALVPLGIRHW